MQNQNTQIQSLPDETTLIDMLPHGSGIDCDWRIEPRRDGEAECFNSFHLRDDYGYYDGWADFSVRLFRHRADVLNPLKGPCAGQVQVVHRKGDWDFKVICRGSAWRRNSAYGLKDMLEEQIGYALESILTNRRETIPAVAE